MIKKKLTTSIIMNQGAKYYLSFLFLAIIVFSCNNKNKSDLENFSSNFEGIENRTWLGPDYWANPLQDWQISQNKIECLVSKENRNIHLLTRQLDSLTGTLEMSVVIGYFNTTISTNNENWAGFSIGSKGEFGDYRDNAIYGKGLNIGLSTNGSLFIGKPTSNDNNKITSKYLEKGVLLKILVSPKEEQYSINFSVYDTQTNKILANISKSEILSKELIGDLVLVSNFKNNKDHKPRKSVWFKNWTIKGSKVISKPDHAYGPIMFSQYTLSKKTLKLTAQMAPVDSPNKLVDLQINNNDSWVSIAQSSIDKDSRTAQFKIENWDDLKEHPYRLVYNLNEANNSTKDYYYEGVIRKNPINKKEIIVAGFTGNNDLGFPNSDIVNQIKYQNPDLLFFSGDQIYEEVGGYYIQLEPMKESKLDYLRKWYLFGWAYKDILKDRPTICITDDHDVYQGNIWGEGGRPTPVKTGHRKHIQDSGGYRMPPEWVQMVERTQTSHLPDPYDPTPVKQDIGVYYTSMNYGEISFAILEDRKFKSAPKGMLKEAKIDNGWPQNKEFNLEKNGDIKGATLLGKRQLNFLENWSSDWTHNAKMKTLLSQTIFANVATLPKEALSDVVVPTLRIMKKGDYPPNDQPVGDLDSNGWPQTGRNNAIKAIRKGFSFHLAGDQHLASTIQYGVDNWNDSGFAFCVPSISNYWPRRWYPEEGGKNRLKEDPKYTGDFKDKFGNKFTVKAVSNPLYTGKKPSKLYDRAAGYGIVRFNKVDRTIKIECWPRGANPKNGDKEQYDGWPITINQTDNFAKAFKVSLPKIKVIGLKTPVITIIDQADNSIISSIRIQGDSFSPKVLKDGNYTIQVGEPDKNLFKKLKNISSKTIASKPELIFNFKI